MHWAILDTDVYIGHWEAGLYDDLLAAVRNAFVVRHDSSDRRTVVTQVGLLLGALTVAVAAGVVVAFGWGLPPLTAANIFAQAEALLTFSTGPAGYHDPFDWVPGGVALTTVGVLLSSAFLVFRPLAASSGHAQAPLRHAAKRIVTAHGQDTLSFFKLRQDNLYFFDSTGQAFVGYRLDGGVLLVSGDPVGPPDAVPGLVRELCTFADARGLKLAVVGASKGFAALSADAGLRSLYIGDEAIVDVEGFSLEGRAIRKVRQSVSRLEKAGYGAEVALLTEVGEDVLDELHSISERWRAGNPERGFSMAMDCLRSEHLSGSTVVLARDQAGALRAFLHLVPADGGKTMSLSAMRRDPDTPNGLMEFLVVRGIQLLGAEGVKELSLNFAAFARCLHSPSGPVDRTLARLMKIADGHFQIESLYRFNTKFDPRWQERYLLYEGPLGLPRAGLVTMWAEGQLPKPRLPRVRTSRPPLFDRAA